MQEIHSTQQDCFEFAKQANLRNSESSCHSYRLFDTSVQIRESKISLKSSGAGKHVNFGSEKTSPRHSSC